MKVSLNKVPMNEQVSHMVSGTTPEGQGQIIYDPDSADDLDDDDPDEDLYI